MLISVKKSQLVITCLGDARELNTKLELKTKEREQGTSRY
jgi:hypothetical protein